MITKYQPVSLVGLIILIHTLNDEISMWCLQCVLLEDFIIVFTSFIGWFDKNIFRIRMGLFLNSNNLAKKCSTGLSHENWTLCRNLQSWYKLISQKSVENTIQYVLYDEQRYSSQNKYGIKIYKNTVLLTFIHIVKAYFYLQIQLMICE